jgi:hypothetical protein
LTDLIAKDFAVFDAAKDVKGFCPNYASLSKEQKIAAIAEFWVAVAYRESGYNPKSMSVDVGTKSDKDSWSVGLYQMSGNDSAAKKFSCNWECLQDPQMNIKVSMEQLRKQVAGTGLFMVPNDSKYRYWSTTTVGNKYSKISELKASVHKYASFCF